MKVNRLETHDRYEFFTKQGFSIEDCCQDLIEKRPFGNHAFYIFAHSRSEDDGFNKRLIWQPRLTKPKAQSNSMLFKAYPGTDTVKIIWMIPQKELWENYGIDKMLRQDLIAQSIWDFQHNIQKLEAKEPDDLTEEAIDEIYRSIASEARMKSTKPKTLEISS